jgi:hypothetical protein
MLLFTAHNLAGSDQGGFNDPYVRLSLVPAVDNRKRQTSIHRNDPNPLFDQNFKFPVSHEDLQDKTLVLQVSRHGLSKVHFPFQSIWSSSISWIYTLTDTNLIFLFTFI